ncbi:hypothetical protein [Streptomyces hirsutus]|uniref:hypothetical protein n=1 Tax=Streptomyces hirsutus TaxID=35620 RepID=UPI00099E3339
MSVTTRGFTLVTYVATLDVPRHVVDHLSRLLAAHRRRIGTPRNSRALGPFRQAVLVLRWFRERCRRRLNLGSGSLSVPEPRRVTTTAIMNGHG